MTRRWLASNQGEPALRTRPSAENVARLARQGRKAFAGRGGVFRLSRILQALGLSRRQRQLTIRRMPLVNIYCSAKPPDPAKADELLAGVSRAVAGLLGKPEQYVMTCLMPQTRMTFSGTPEPACYVELKSIGKMSPQTTQKLSAEICQRVEAALGVSGQRTYVEFANAEGYLWGWNGSTFG